MAEYTKGEWEVEEYQDQRATIGSDRAWRIYCGDHDLAYIGSPFGSIGIPDNEYESIVYLIVTAVNACIKLNPDNPQAVAENIGKIYKALKKTTKSLSDLTIIYGNGIIPGDAPIIKQANKALSLAEGK